MNETSFLCGNRNVITKFVRKKNCFAFYIAIKTQIFSAHDAFLEQQSSDTLIVKHYNSNTYHPIQIYVIQDTSTNKNDRHDIAEILLKVTLNTITLESKIALFRANIKRRRIFSCTRHVSGMTFIIIRYSRPTVLLI